MPHLSSQPRLPTDIAKTFSDASVKPREIRMWTLMLISYLGLSIFQATAKENSTQMYHVRLKIDVNAIRNVSQFLSVPFVTDPSLQIHRLQMTTICERVHQRAECMCLPGFSWPDAVCAQHACCAKETCIFHQNPLHMCIPNTTVSVAGSLTLRGRMYQDCLAEKSNPVFITCNQNVTTEVKKVYSALNGFDSLKINKYSVGSVIAHFEMTIFARFESEFLEALTVRLVKNLNSSFYLETSGVVSISRPPNPIHYSSMASVICTVPSNLNTLPQWKIKKEQRVYDVTNGTEATIVSSTTQTTVTLRNVSELWQGEFSCTYINRQDSFTISHKASTIIDVCLNQNVHVTTTPSFPRCTESSGLVYVRTNCTLKNTHENYTVEWKTENITADLRELDVFSSGTTVTYSAETYVSCGDNRQPTVTCTFKNRCNQTSTGIIKIVIISVTDNYCEARGDWQDTKAGYNAVLPCKPGTGWRRRKCTIDGKFEAEESMCVNQDLHGVLQNAVIVNSGLGALDSNAAEVFSQFKTATNNTKSINSVANINVSVDVLESLRQKLNNINNETTADDLLQTSSNLLESSLEDSWTPKDTGETLAERYLESVEHLIEITNVTKAKSKANLELAVCGGTQDSLYTNKVFNVSVSLSGSVLSQVKTAGFKNLQEYFPNNDTYGPNSIIVSTTAQRKQGSDVEIKINFQLLKPRPRNTKLQCVWWDKNISQWSSTGCNHVGPSDEGHCVCTHLSSFAVLMAKSPLVLRWVDEITYVGLSVSVVSLIISLLIELIIWSRVVKTGGLYLRHIAHVNICLCLLIADICFLASSQPKSISSIWCQTFVVLKHFFYLSMFFWILCLSSTLLHRTVFPFHEVSKKNYLRFSIILGYVCPLLIVFITFVTNKAGAQGYYFSSDTCWLIYSGPMKGSLHTFLVPVGIIVFVSVFSMLVVIMKLLGQTNNADRCNQSDKNAAKTVVRTVVLLTPIFGVTWIFGFGVTYLDLADGDLAYVVNYAFILLNSFQGLFILLTINLGEKSTREALMNFLTKKTPSVNVSTSKTDLTPTSSLKK